jgi:hypothetical protein
VHAIVHGDLSFCRYEPLLAPVGAISAKNEDGTRCRNKYPPGVGLIQFPFSALVLAEDPSQTGFSTGENRVVLWGGSALLFATAALMYQLLLRRQVPLDTALGSTLALVFGTGLFHYATYDASFSHVYSAFGVTLLAWIAMDRPRLGGGRLVAFAIVAAWLYLVRQTNAALSLAVVYLVVQQLTRQERWRVVAAWTAGTAVAVAALLAYGRYVNGATSLSNYGDEGFPTFAGHAFDVLVSYERGLFTYYPVLLVVGILAIAKIRRPASHAFLGLIAIFTVLYGSWHAWHLGAGFGHRGFVELAPFGMLVMAESLTSMRQSTRRVWTAVIAACCIATTLAMTAYWRGELPIHGAVAGQYWRSISPASLFPHKPRKYSKQEVRSIGLDFLGATQFPDGHWEVQLRVRNENGATPLNVASDNFLPLRVSWRVADVGADIHNNWQTRQDLPVLEPGQSQEISVSVPTPVSTGEHKTLQFTVVQETAFWAHDVGVPPLTISWDAADSHTIEKTD